MAEILYAILFYVSGIIVAYALWKYGKYTEDKECIVLSWAAVFTLLLALASRKFNK